MFSLFLKEAYPICCGLPGFLFNTHLENLLQYSPESGEASVCYFWALHLNSSIQVISVSMEGARFCGCCPEDTLLDSLANKTCVHRFNLMAVNKQFLTGYVHRAQCRRKKKRKKQSSPPLKKVHLHTNSLVWPHIETPHSARQDIGTNRTGWYSTQVSSQRQDNSRN